MSPNTSLPTHLMSERAASRYRLGRDDWPLTRRQDDAPKSRHTLSAHRLTNERKGFLADCQGR